MRLSAFRVQGFKNFRQEIALDDLGPINVIHGDNNVGKSNLVESIGLLFTLLDEIFEVTARARLLAPDMRPDSALLDSYEGSGASGEMPPHVLRKKQIDQAHLKRLGYSARESFNLSEPLPIRLEGIFAISPVELGRAGIQSPLPVERVRVGVQLTLVGGALEAALHHFELDEETELESLSSRYPTFLRQLVSFLVQSRPGGTIAPRFALVTTDRAMSSVSSFPTAGEVWTGDSGGHRRRDLIPQDLCLALYDAKESTDSSLSGRWKLFVSAMQRFDDMLGAGELVVVYDRRTQRASLVFENANGERVPADMLGSGVQQAASLVGRLLMTRASLLAIEEPELNLKYTRQLLLRDVLHDLVANEAGPSQLFLTSHSPAFESDAPFYAMQASPEGPMVERRPFTEAAEFTEHLTVAPAAGLKRPPRSYVSSDGLVMVPEDIRDMLGLKSGGGVVFIERKDDGHVEMLSNEQFLGLLNDPREDEHDRE